MNAGRQRAGAQNQGQIVRLLLARKTVDAAGIADRALNGGDAANLVIQHHREAVADIGLGKLFKAPGAILGKRETALPASRRIGIGGGARAAHVLSGDYRAAADHVPGAGAIAGPFGPVQNFGADGQNAAFRGERFFLRFKGLRSSPRRFSTARWCRSVP